MFQEDFIDLDVNLFSAILKEYFLILKHNVEALYLHTFFVDPKSDFYYKSNVNKNV
jgi:hypothetical protein